MQMTEMQEAITSQRGNRRLSGWDNICQLTDKQTLSLSPYIFCLYHRNGRQKGGFQGPLSYGSAGGGGEFLLLQISADRLLGKKHPEFDQNLQGK